ncbi:MAG: TolC family protein [Calditrichaeota bacterium]|nr:MAG: TolC family protein [Calditrichota bacterium]MBL1207348.1 TolC family protein [Calditrichota bacterium]NOG47181.1 TolC family protein [Calditrichota bacterium]
MSIRSFLIFLLIAGNLFAQGKQISLAITDLPELLVKTSPQQSLINARQAIIKAQGDEALQWSNPEFSYDQEYVENNGNKETEKLAYVSKTFSLPWNYWQRRSIWRANLEAAKLNMEQDSKQLLASVRTGYIKVGLLKKLSEQQINLKEVFKNLKQAAHSQSEEGAISKMEARLLAMSIFGLEGDLLLTQKENSLALSSLKQILGFDSSDDIILSTSIPFLKIDTDIFEETELTKNHPGLKAAQLRLSALEQRITLEKSRILPSITLHGGYKKIDPGWKGYTFGLSIPLPLLNWNGPQIEKQKIVHHMQMTENALYSQKIRSQIVNLVETVKRQAELLQEYGNEQSNNTLVEDILAAYKEGTMSLAEFLNAIQIYREGSKQYTEQLTEYYQAVFELEALYGQQLVTF